MANDLDKNNLSRRCNWIHHGGVTPESRAIAIQQDAGLDFPEILIRILLERRIISGPDDLKRYLYPSLEHLPKPDSMLGIKEAVDLLEKNIRDHGPIIVYGDYDADGITASALLVSFFKEIGGAAGYYIPQRDGEGYGLNKGALRKISARFSKQRQNGNPVLITVDCGITNVSEVNEAQRLGFRVIITDHHRPGPILPSAEAVINPHQPGCAFPFKHLAGVGVAFYLIAGLRRRLIEGGYFSNFNPPNLKKYLDLVAIGSIADMVPLVGANRIMVRAGLELMRNSPRPGIMRLMDRIGGSCAEINSETISFQLAPRINAAGRMASGENALKLLLTADLTEAERWAKVLEAHNRERRILTEENLMEARRQAEDQLAAGMVGLVLVSPDWHLGVLGLVATRIVREYNRPTLALKLDLDEGTAVGSARSIGGLDIYDILAGCNEYLIRFGGHKAAAGLSIENREIAAFARIFNQRVADKIGLKIPLNELNIDCRIRIGRVFNRKFMGWQHLMEPFGAGNPQPLYCSTEQLTVTGLKELASQAIRFRVLEGEQHFEGIGFGLAGIASGLMGKRVQMAYKINYSYFRGTRRLELRAEDIVCHGN